MQNPQVQVGISKRIYEQGDVVSATEPTYRLSLRDRDRAFFRDFIQHEGGLSKLWRLTKLPDAQSRLKSNAEVFLKVSLP